MICPPGTLFTVPPSVLVPETALILPVELFVSVSPPWMVPPVRFRVAPADKVNAPPFTTALTVPVVPAPSRMVPLVLVNGPPERVSAPAPVV